MKKETTSGFIVFFILLLCAGACIWYTKTHKDEKAAQYSVINPTGNPSGYSTDTIDIKKSGNEYIAALYVEGTIEDANSTYNQAWLLSTISRLKKDSNNVAIAMYVNSPGGGVYQADEVYFALKDYKSAGKKFYVYMGPLAASGGYYISCPADKIYANRNTLTGSIGVIAGQLIDATELLDNIGITIEAIHSGRNKLMGNFYSEITSEQEDIMQSISDECYEQFVSIVANERNMKLEDVKKLADGRVYTATQATRNHLIDGIRDWNTMIGEIRADVNISDCKVITYKYEHKQTFRESMFGIFTNLQNKSLASKLGIPVSVLNDLEGFNSYPAYLYRQ